MQDTPIFAAPYAGYGYSNFDVTGGSASPATGSERLKPKWEKEYVAAGEGYAQATVPHVLPAAVDDIARDFGPRTYDAMLTDPIVHSSVMTLVMGILAGGMDLVPPGDFAAKAGKKPSRDEARAAKMVDFCWRCVESSRGWNASMIELAGAVATGAKCAEKVYRVASTGPDRGKLVLDRLSMKPREAWAFTVEPGTFNVNGIECTLKGSSTRAILPRDKFLVHSWMPRDGDPRGTAILRPAYGAWNLKQQTWAQYFLYLVQFASGKIFGKTAPGEEDRYQIDAEGNEITSLPRISPQGRMAMELARLQNGSVFVSAAGSETEMVFPQSNGDPFLQAIELFNQEITHAILMQTRATREAQHGSKADSQQGQDVLGLLIAHGRESLGNAYREDLFRHLIRLNYGDEWADQFTPLVTFGHTEPQDEPAKWTAAASLWAGGQGYLGRSQLMEFDSMLGLPLRDMEADEEHAKQAQQEAMAQQAAQQGTDPNAPADPMAGMPDWPVE